MYFLHFSTQIILFNVGNSQSMKQVTKQVEDNWICKQPEWQNKVVKAFNQTDKGGNQVQTVYRVRWVLSNLFHS